MAPLPQVDADRAKDRGFTPLYIACQEGFAEVAKLLMAHPTVDVNRAIIDGSTPVYIAAQEGHAEVVLALLGDPRLDAGKPRKVETDNTYKCEPEGTGCQPIAIKWTIDNTR